jgi:hypothetical protein
MKTNFIRFFLTLIYVSILWSIIGVIAVRLTDTQGIQSWGLTALCFVGAICHVGSVTFYDLARRMY